MKKTLILSLSIIISLGVMSFHLLVEKPISSSESTDYSWLAGHWTGDGFGGHSEEVWAPAVDGTMMGMYRHYNKEGKIVFYEFLLIDETGLKLKHFNPDLTGWETKDEFVTFPMVGHSEYKLEFKGLTFELKNENEMEIRLKMKRKGEIETEVFSMKRVK